MAGLKKFERQRFEYLKTRHPEIIEELEDHGVLEIHLRYAQKRADRHMDQLIMAGLEEFEAEEIVRREIIQV